MKSYNFKQAPSWQIVASEFQSSQYDARTSDVDQLPQMEGWTDGWIDG